MAIINLYPPEINMEPLPETPESILRAKLAQQNDRLRAMRDMGVPTHLLVLTNEQLCSLREAYTALGYEDMAMCVSLLLSMRVE